MQELYRCEVLLSVTYVFLCVYNDDVICDSIDSYIHVYGVAAPNYIVYVE